MGINHTSIESGLNWWIVCRLLLVVIHINLIIQDYILGEKGSMPCPEGRVDLFLQDSGRYLLLSMVYMSK